MAPGLDVEIAIGCALRAGVPLKQGEPGEIICLEFEQVGDLWGQGLLAILEDAEEFSVRGNFVVAGLMELQQILSRTTQGVIDVDDKLVRIVDAEQFSCRGFYTAGCFDGLGPDVGKNAGGIKNTARGDLQVCRSDDIFNRSRKPKRAAAKFFQEMSAQATGRRCSGRSS